MELESYDKCQELRALLKRKNRFILIRSPGKKVGLPFSSPSSLLTLFGEFQPAGTPEFPEQMKSSEAELLGSWEKSPVALKGLQCVRRKVAVISFLSWGKGLPVA